MDTNDPPKDPSSGPFYNKQVVNRILDIVRSHPIYNQRVIDQILDIASDCEPSPPAPQPRFYYTREDGQEHLKQFAARHGYALNVRRSDNQKVDMVCSRWPDPKAKITDNDGTPSRDRKSNGCNCQFRVQLRRRTGAPQRRRSAAPTENQPQPIWQLRIQHGTHNHGPKRRRPGNPAHPPVSVSTEMTGNDPSEIDFSLLGDSPLMNQSFCIPEDGVLSPPEPPMFEQPLETPEEREASPPALPQVPPPAPPARFYDSRELGQQDINAFAASHGYSLTVRRSDPTKVDLVCSRWPDPANPRERKTNGTNCPFRLQFRRRAGAPQKPGYIILSDPPPQTGWELRIQNGEHNHGPQSASLAKKKRKKSEISGSSKPQESSSTSVAYSQPQA
jgi:hypothetical protein